MNPNADHNPPVSQPQKNAIWHPAILPPINVDPLPFQPFEQEPFQPFDQQPVPLDPGPTFQFMFQPPKNPKENLNGYMFACCVLCYMVYYVALENEFAHCTYLGFWRFHLSGNQAIYSMVAVEEEETS